MTPQPLSSSQLQTMLLEAKSKSRLLLTRSEQEICPSDSAVPARQKQLIKLEQQRQGFLSDPSHLPAYRIQLKLEPGNRKRLRESDPPKASQPTSEHIDQEDQVLVTENNKRRCTEIQDDQPDELSSDTKPKTQPLPAGHTGASEVSNSPTDKRHEPSTSPQVKAPTCRSPGISSMEPDQKCFRADNPNGTIGSEQRAPIVYYQFLSPSVKPEVTNVGPQSPRDEGDMAQNSEEQRCQGTTADEADPPSISTDQEASQPIYDAQPEAVQKDEGVHSIPTPQASPDWPLFEPDEGFDHHATIAPASAECSNLHLLLELPDTPMRLFEVDSPSGALWQDDLPSVEPFPRIDSQSADIPNESDTMNPAHLDQRNVDEALISKPPVREHPLYNGIKGSDGLYHCPWEKEASCNHKPAKLKCAFDKFIDSHLKPYHCRVPDCQSGSFSSTACLFRHEREAHALHGYADKPFLCPQKGCERATPGNGFPRRWNLTDHMRRRHKLDASTAGIIDSRTLPQVKMENKTDSKEDTKEGTKESAKGEIKKKTKREAKGSTKKGTKEGSRGDTKEETKKSTLPPAEADADLKAAWKTHQAAFGSILAKLTQPDGAENAELTEQLQHHLSAMAEIQAKMSRKK